MDPLDFCSSDSGLDTPSPPSKYPETQNTGNTGLETPNGRDKSSDPISPEADIGEQTNQILSVAQDSHRTIRNDIELSSTGVEETTGMNGLQKNDTFSYSVREAFPAYLQAKKVNSKVISNEKYQEYIEILTAGPSSPIPPGLTNLERRRLRAKRKRVFQSFIVENGSLYNFSSGKNKLVITEENILDTVESIHESVSHGGQNVTWLNFDNKFYGVSRADVEWLVSRCTHCHLQQANNTRAPHTPIESPLNVAQVQIDVVDLSYDASHGYKWLLHVKNHFSKVTKLYPLTDKSSSVIADHLREYFRYYGTPEIVQIGQGIELRGAVLDLMNQRNIKVSHGGPRNPRVQSSVVNRKFSAWRSQGSHSDWQHGLKLIEMDMNRSQCKGLPTGYSPHKAMLGENRRLEINAKTTNFETSERDIDSR